MVAVMDFGELSTAVVPFVSAAAAAYGGAVVHKATEASVDSGADATVAWGRRLLARLLLSGRGTQITEAVEELAEDPADEASQAVLQAQVRKALTADPALARELESMLRQAGGDQYHVRISHSSGFQIGSNNVQHNVTRPPAG
ncbi:hypothetical protein ACQP2F_28530 [Actinoplanes sp. CA-030573]|uniref:hypothetical protein n=1 Tax=Actinoplanes sp. CA-030573 TaxID=3239898 RepID=UPI003D90ADED